MRKNKKYISYIENGKETIVSVNKFNEKKLLENNLRKDRYCGNYNFYRNLSLELVYFKNFIFDDDSVNFFGSVKQGMVFILDNCLFKGNEVSFYYFDNVQVINPSFESKDNIKIYSENVNDLDIILNKSGSVDSGFEFETYNCKRFSLDGNENKCNFFVEASDVCIKNINYIDKFLFEGDKVKIINSNIFCNDSGYNDYLDDNFIDIKTKEMQLFDSSIISSFHNISGNGGSFFLDKISGSNYEIKFSGGIRVNGDYYSNANRDKYCILFSDEVIGENKELVARRNLISILKGIRDCVNDDISGKVDLIRIFYDDEIRKQTIKLLKIKSRASNRVDDYQKKLIKSKFTDFMR